jgi:hypothetical protein
MTTAIVLTDDELSVVAKALLDAYYSTAYLREEIEIIGDLLDQLPTFD